MADGAQQYYETQQKPLTKDIRSSKYSSCQCLAPSLNFPGPAGSAVISCIQTGLYCIAGTDLSQDTFCEVFKAPIGLPLCLFDWGLSFLVSFRKLVNGRAVAGANKQQPAINHHH
jgi:hypothetical protein